MQFTRAETRSTDAPVLIGTSSDPSEERAYQSNHSCVSITSCREITAIPLTRSPREKLRSASHFRGPGVEFQGISSSNGVSRAYVMLAQSHQ